MSSTQTFFLINHYVNFIPSNLQILCHRATPRVSAVHDASNGWLHVGQRVGASGSDILYAHLPRLVHDIRTSRDAQGQSTNVHFRGQQGVRNHLQFDQLLDPGNRHDYDVLQDI